MALSCISSEIKPDIGRKSWFFFIPPLHSTPPLGDPSRNIAISFGMRKLEWWGYPIVENFEDIYNRLDSIPACDRRTDILPRHSPRYTYASRGKNRDLFITLCIRRPHYGGPRRNIAIMFGMEKLKWWRYLTVNFFRICSAVLTEYWRVTDGQTDGRTDILWQHSPRYAYASRGNKYIWAWLPHPAIHRIEVRSVGRPRIWCDEVRGLVSPQLNGLIRVVLLECVISRR